MPDCGRSYKRITLCDLCRLGEIAKADREDFFARYPRYGLLREYILAVALCQGAGLHYVNGTNGIKDLDVWTFYAKHPSITYPPRRPITPIDFGRRKFGLTIHPASLAEELIVSGVRFEFPRAPIRSQLSTGTWRKRTPTRRQSWRRRASC